MGTRGWTIVALAAAALLPAMGVEAAIPQSERDALLALYTATNGDSWGDNTGWGGAAGTECTWHGVTCDSGETTVIGIDLASNQLDGTIPPEIADLTNLEVLDLSWNYYLSGAIPPELGNISNLRELNLSTCRLTGAIPAQLGNLGNLEVLDLGWNRELSGPIPPELGDITALTTLDVGNNLLTGPIPPELADLSNLVKLELSKNLLRGPVPRELGNLSGLEILSLHTNRLSGPIPPELGNLRNLVKLSLYKNRLSGPIPPELGGLSSLERLSLGKNRLSGGIPPELGGLSTLTYLSLRSNLLTGTIPARLGGLANLTNLYIQGNQLTGEVPTELANLTSLSDAGSDFRWNGLHTADPALAAFLAQKQYDGDWTSTQTVWPENVTAGDGTVCSVTLAWDAVAYTADAGGYRIETAPSASGPWEEAGILVPSKAATSVAVTGLDPGTTYWLRVRSYTLPHDDNPGTVLGDPSPAVQATTLPSGDLIDGDVDGDTSTDTDDLSALLGYMFGPEPAYRPDVDCGGDVNAGDLSDLVGLLAP